MSDGRKKLSGAAYRKRVFEKEKKIEDELRKTPTLHKFFSKSDNFIQSENHDVPNPNISQEIHNPNPEHLSSAHSSQNPLPSDPKSIDIPPLIPALIEVDETADSGHLKNAETFSEQWNNDPALWNINDSTRDYVALYGYDQNKNCDFSRSKRIFNSTVRYFTPNLFIRKLLNGEVKSRTWMIYSISLGSVYCGPCLLFNGTSQFASKEGFSDWRNAGTRISAHENSDVHQRCEISLKERANIANRIDKRLVDQREHETSYWKNVLLRVVAAVKALSIRGLPLRGHDEHFGTNNNGNYCMALELIAEFDSFLARHIERYANRGSGKVSYLSKTVCEEIIQIMALQVQQTICKEIEVSKYYSIIVDSTPDISHIDQLSIIIRYVKNGVTPVERFLKFQDNVGHKAAELTDVILKVLESYNINISNCRGQSYDNAANMSGIYSGLQTRIKAVNPLANFVPCSAHSLNLIGTCAAESCDEACTFFDTVQHLYTFFSASTHRWEILLSSLKPGSRTIKQLSATRWSARNDAILSLKESYCEILKSLEQLQNDFTEKPATRSEAKGLLGNLKKLESVLMLCFWGDIFERLNSVNKLVQAVDINIADVCDLLNSLCKYLNEIREKFDFYEEQALSMSELKDYKANLSRKKKRKVPFDENRDSDGNLHPRDHFRISTFYVIIDNLTIELTRRSKVYKDIYEKYTVLLEINKLSIDEIREKAENLRKSYLNDLEETFVNECLHFQTHCKVMQFNKQQYRPSNLLAYLQKTRLQDVFPNIQIALRMFVCTAVANCSAERSFSCLKRIKNYLRSKMSQERLNSLACLAIESELTAALDNNDIIKIFMQQKDRRVII